MAESGDTVYSIEATRFDQDNRDYGSPIGEIYADRDKAIEYADDHNLTLLIDDYNQRVANWERSVKVIEEHNALVAAGLRDHKRDTPPKPAGVDIDAKPVEPRFGMEDWYTVVEEQLL